MKVYANMVASLSPKDHLLKVFNGTAYDMTRSEIIATCSRLGLDIHADQIQVINLDVLQVASKADIPPRRNIQASNILSTLRAAQECTPYPYAEASDTVVYLHNAIQSSGVIKKITASGAVITNSILNSDHTVSPECILKVSKVSAGFSTTSCITDKEIAEKSLGLI